MKTKEFVFFLPAACTTNFRIFSHMNVVAGKSWSIVYRTCVEFRHFLKIKYKNAKVTMVVPTSFRGFFVADARNATSTVGTRASCFANNYRVQIMHWGTGHESVHVDDPLTRSVSPKPAEQQIRSIQKYSGKQNMNLNRTKKMQLSQVRYITTAVSTWERPRRFYLNTHMSLGKFLQRKKIFIEISKRCSYSSWQILYSVYAIIL